MSRSSFTTWAGLHVSGMLLLVFVFAHLAAVHYAGDVMEDGYTFANVSARMQGGIYPIMNLTLLVLALVHGLAGLHRFIGHLDLCGDKAMRVVGIVLAGAGAWGLVYGVQIYLAFTS